LFAASEIGKDTRLERAVDDDLLEKLEYNEYLNWYAGEIELGEAKKLRVSLSLDGCEDLDDLVRFTKKFLQEIAETDTLARRFAAEKLLRVYNDSWNEGEDIAESEFTERIALESLTTYPDHSAELCYDDGDLFFGHIIIVSIEEGLTFVDASIAG
jgi:hypothetical protein